MNEKLSIKIEDLRTREEENAQNLNKLRNKEEELKKKKRGICSKKK